MKKEIISLYIVQVSNILIPLTVFPYFNKVLGIDGMGKIGFAQTLFLLFSFLIDFGFNLTGARTISIYRQQGRNYQDVYSNILIFKFLLFLILIILCFFSLFFFPLNNEDKKIIWLALFASFSSVFIPNFVYNALSINSKLAKMILMVRVVSLLPVFIFIKKKQDYFLAIELLLLPNLLVGIFAQSYIVRTLGIKFIPALFQKKLLIDQVNEAFHNFSASTLTLGFTYGIPLVIKFSLGDVALGIYTISDKIIVVLRQLYIPFIQAFYAKFCIMYENQDWVSYKVLISKIILVFLAIGFTALFGNYIFGDWVLSKIFGHIDKLNLYLTISIITQIFVSFAMILINFYILPSNQAYILKKIYGFALIIFIPILFFLQSYFKLIGFFISMLVIEIIITVLIFYYSYKKSKPIIMHL